jgi:hypothetical protein
LLLVALAVFIQREAELLNGGNDDLVGVVVGEEAAHKACGVGVFLHATFLELVELLARLPVQVFAVHDEEAFFDVGVVLEQRGCLEGSQRFATASGVPYVPVAAVLVNAVDDGLDRINLIRTHHHQLLFAGDEHHVAANHLAQGAFDEEAVRKVVQVGDLLVVFACELINGQEALLGIEGEVASVVVGEVVGAVAIADDEELDEAQQRAGVAVAGVVFVIDDLLHSPARVDAERFQLDLRDRYAVDEQNDVVTMVAVVCVDAQLVDDLEGVFAPVLDVDQGEIERSAVVAGEAAALAQRSGGGEHVRANDFFEQAGKFALCERYAVQGLELGAEVLLQRCAVANVLTVFVFQAAELRYELVFKLAFLCCH